MKLATAILVAAALLLFGVGQAKAGIIVGPTIDHNIVGYQDSGIEFSALTNTTLLSFVYQNQGATDTIKLLASDKTTVLDSVTIPASNPTFLVSGLNWSLTAGNDYYLEATNLSNGRYAFYTTYPTSDADLRVNYSFFDPFLPFTQMYWADFNNLTTGQGGTATPEPATLTMLGFGIAGMAGYGWRRRKQAVTA